MDRAESRLDGIMKQCRRTTGLQVKKRPLPLWLSLRRLANSADFMRLSSSVKGGDEPSGLLQLRVFRLGLREDGNFRVSIFPKCEEIVICSTGFRRAVCKRVGAAQTDMR
jgi:hypothetical protein